MKDHIHAVHCGHDSLALANIAVDDADASVLHRPLQIGWPTASEIVEDDQLADPALDQLVGDGGPDASRAAGNERDCATKLNGHDSVALRAAFRIATQPFTHLAQSLLSEK